MSRKKIVEFLLVLGCILIFYCIHFYSYFGYFSDYIFYFDNEVDPMHYVGNLWEHTERLQNNEHYFFHPVGAENSMRKHLIFPGILDVVLQNSILSINLSIAIQLCLFGMGIYYLVRFFNIQSSFSIVIMYFSVFNTYLLSKTGVHYNMVLIGPTSWGILYFFKLLYCNTSKEKWRYSVWLFILLILSYFSDYYSTFYILSFIVIFYAWKYFFESFFQNFFTVKKIAIVLIVFVSTHFIIQGLRSNQISENAALWSASSFEQLLKPVHHSKYLSNASIPLDSKYPDENKIFMGYSVFILLSISIILYARGARRKFSLVLLFTSVIFLLVSIPLIRIGGREAFYFPNAIIHFIPFINEIRVPSRFILMFFVFASIFAFYQLNALKFFKRRIMSGLFSVFMISILFIEHSQQIMTKANRKEHELLVGKKDKAILYLPFWIADGKRQLGNQNINSIFTQTEYGFKSPNGYIPRMPDKTYNYFSNNKFYKSLIEMQSGKSIDVTDVNYLHNAMENQNLDYVYYNENLKIEFPILYKFISNQMRNNDNLRIESYKNHVLLIKK